MLKFAYHKHCNVGVGDDAVMDLVGWRRMLIDCALYQRAAAAMAAQAAALASPLASNRHVDEGSSETDTPLAQASSGEQGAGLPTGVGMGVDDAVATHAGFDDMKGKRLNERELVQCFLLSQTEDESAPSMTDTEVESLATAVLSGPRAISAYYGANLSASGAGTPGGSVSEMSFSEFVEALARVATLKWDDPTMPLHEKLARVIDSIAVRLITDPSSGWKPGVADTVKAAHAATKRLSHV